MRTPFAPGDANFELVYLRQHSIPVSDLQRCRLPSAQLGKLRPRNLGLFVHKRTLTPAQYCAIADVPPELELLANITGPKIRRAYKLDVSKFSAFSGL